MDQELDRKLVEDFPLLYRNRYGDMRTTCMVWGFPGRGWFDIIYELSEKLENKIRKLPPDICYCGHPKTFHRKSKLRARLENWLRAYYWRNYSRRRLSGKILRKWITKINHFLLIKISRHCKEKGCECGNFSDSRPVAVQVKEKFGVLRYYMSHGTEEMHDWISEAERKSARTCEDCGKPGKYRSDLGWYLTLCDDCHLKHKQHKASTNS